MEHNPNHKGNVAELAIAKEAASLGLSVLVPLTEHGPYDLAIEIGGKLMRVQCKWAGYDGDVITVRVDRCRTKRRGYVRNSYRADEIDALAAYCEPLDRCYLLPVDMVVGRRVVCLRVSPTRNGQRAAINCAAVYEFGAVAQLAERRYGIPEAEGSSPSSSTNQENPSQPTSEEVGAHEFRNHFGYYMERAAAGTEILVSRRGKPYTRLCPAQPPAAATRSSDPERS
jgi:prevent-host-death family protein